MKVLASMKKHINRKLIFLCKVIIVTDLNFGSEIYHSLRSIIVKQKIVKVDNMSFPARRGQNFHTLTLRLSCLKFSWNLVALVYSFFIKSCRPLIQLDD